MNLLFSQSKRGPGYKPSAHYLAGSRSVVYGLSCLFGLGLLCLPCSVIAQEGGAGAEDKKPVASVASTKPQDPYREAYNRFRSVPGTAGAVAEALQFLRANRSGPNVNHAMVSRLYLWAAQIQVKNLKDLKGALATLDEATQAHPDKNPFIQARSDVLMAGGRFAEAEALFAAEWTQLLQTDAAAALSLLPRYVEVLNQQNKSAAALELVQRFATQQPAQLANGTLIKLMIEQLLANGRTDEALGWGKLYFMLAPYSEKSLMDATQVLAKLWTAKYLTPVKTQELVGAMQDPSKTNPLREIKLPELNLATLQQQAASIDKTQDRISLLLIAGDGRSAMIEAQKLVLSAPSSTQGLLEVCRVFKAQDLDLKRANAFLNYYKTGNGVNPVTEFLQEQ